jgi:hypothetical protein
VVFIWLRRLAILRVCSLPKGGVDIMQERLSPEKRGRLVSILLARLLTGWGSDSVVSPFLKLNIVPCKKFLNIVIVGLHGHPVTFMFFLDQHGIKTDLRKIQCSADK